MAKIKVLIVEDENIIALDIRRTLVRLGYDPIGTVSSGERAVEIARNEHPHVILMDINLKGKMNGVQAAEAINCDQNIPIIFLSAMNTINNFYTSSDIKAAGHLIKPFEEFELQETLSKALSHMEPLE